MKSLLAASAAQLLWVPAAAAQERDPDDIIVTGERPTGETAQAAQEAERIAGGVEIVPDTVFKNGPAQNVKDILAFVPGVITQHRMGDDARISIRGSGLSRAYGNRGITLYVDGIPLNTADGLLDLFEIDPTAYRHVEVFRGANALRYGSNALGGAINLVTPKGPDSPPLEGRIDAGSFGYLKGQAALAGQSGALDYFATVSGQRIDGYRDHSEGDAIRGNLNLGYRLSPDVETRFYVYGASTNQRIPGEVTKAQALGSPRSANGFWVLLDQQRNVDSVRVANRTVLRLDRTALEVGASYNYRHVRHPIFQWLDFSVDDFAGFLRAADDRSIGGLRNRLVVGATLQKGHIDTEQFVNLPGAVKGALAASMLDRSGNLSFYGEDSLNVRPDFALIAGIEYLHATRNRRDRFLSNGDQSGRKSYDLWSPRIGLLWDVRSDWQLFANVSRSAEVPTFDSNSFASPASSNLRAQRATTYEIGTRGRRGEIGWDLSLYRAEIRNELQCLTTGPFSPCSVVNAGRTVHQGLEAGLDGSFPLSAFASGDSLSLNAAYTYNDFYFDGDALYGDNRLPGVPKHHLRAEMLYRHPKGLFAGPNVEWVPRRYFADNANSLAAGAYALVNFRAGFDSGERLSLYVEGRNLTARTYISTVAVAGVADPDSEIFNPGTGRAVHGGLRYRF